MIEMLIMKAIKLLGLFQKEQFYQEKNLHLIAKELCLLIVFKVKI